MITQEIFLLIEIRRNKNNDSRDDANVDDDDDGDDVFDEVFLPLLKSN